MKRRTLQLGALLVLWLIPVDGSWLSNRIGINIDLNRQVGTGLASMGAPVVEKFEETGDRLIDKMSKTLDSKLEKVDQIATEHEQRIQRIVQVSITQVDGVIKSEIDHADEVLETRLGNADVIAAKAELGFEEVVRRLILLGCILVFLTAVAIRVTGKAKLTKYGWVDCGIAAASLAVVYFAYAFLPHGHLVDVIDVHERGYRDALSILDFREAKYHLAQLKILEPGDRKILGQIKKVDLLQGVLGRPAMYQTRPGVFDFETKLAQAEFLLPDDPDLKVITAFVNWQTGTEKIDEYASASVCTAALLKNPPPRNHNSDSFFLRALAVQYVRSYQLSSMPEQLINTVRLQQKDLPQSSPEEMSRAIAENSHVETTPLNAMSEVLRFNTAVTTLYRKMVPAYVGMTDADARFTVATDESIKAALKVSRAKFARTVEESWREFDTTIARFNDTNSQLWAMRVSTVFLNRVGDFDDRTADQKYTEEAHIKLLSSLLEKIVPTNDPVTNQPNKVRLLIDTEVKKSREANGAIETKFVKDLSGFYAVTDIGTNEAKVNAARSAEMTAATLGLFTCGESFNCESLGATQPYSEVIEGTLTKKVSKEFRVPDLGPALLQVDAGSGYRARSLFTL